MILGSITLPKQDVQDVNDTRCGAYCLAYYTHILDNESCAESEIDDIYTHVKFQANDITGIGDELKDQFLRFSNPIRMMQWLYARGLNPKFYTGDQRCIPLQQLIPVVRENWRNTITDDMVINESLPIDQIGWFIAIWHTGQGVPQHYVLYHRTTRKIIAYNPTADMPKTVVDDLPNQTDLSIMASIRADVASAGMTYHGAGIWIG